MPDLSNSDVLFTLCLQREYVDPSGPLRCVNAGPLLRSSKHIMALARWARLPVLACVDTHRPHDIGAEYVAAGLEGQAWDKVPPFALMPQVTLVESDNCLCMPLDILARFQQAIFSKVHRDPFTNPKLDRLLTEMPARRFVLMGAGLETSVRLLALGLLRRGRRVAIVQDSCGYWNEQEAGMVLRQLSVKGCEMMTADAFVREALARLSQRPPQRLRKRRFVA